MNLGHAARGSLRHALTDPRAGRRLFWRVVAAIAVIVAADFFLFAPDARARWMSGLPPWLLRVVGRSTGDAVTYHALGRQQREAGDYPHAAASFQRAMTLAPDFLLARAEYADALVDLNRDEEARSLASQVLATDRNAVPALVAVGRLRARYGEWPLAADAAEQAVRAAPDDADARLLEARVAAFQGNRTRAAAACRKATALRPRFSDAWAERAQIALSAGDVTDAVASARRAAELRPDSAFAQRCLGLALLSAGQANDLPAAEAALRFAAGHGVQDADTAVGLARVLAQEGHAAEAESVVRSLIASQPDSLEAYPLLADLYRRQGKAEQARACRGEEHRWRDFERQRRAIQARIGRMDYDARPHFDLARLYVTMGLWDRARTEVNSGLGHAEIPEGLALLKELDRHDLAAAAARETGASR